MVEKVRKTLDEGGWTGDVLTEWFDCIDYNLLLARLNAYGFEKQSIDFTYSHITKRKQRTKVEYGDSSSQMFFSGVPQGVLGLLLFNMYVCDVLLTDILQI